MNEEAGLPLSSRVARGAVALGLRQVVVAVLTLGASIVFARHLTAAEFGFYGLLLLLMNMSALLVQAGIAPALVRLHEDPSAEELRAAFGLQLVIGLAFGLVVAGVGPAFQHIYPSVPDGALAVAVVALGAALVPLTSISMIKLERSVRIAEVGLLLAVQPVVFCIVGSVLVQMHRGIIGIAAAFVVSMTITIPIGFALSGAPPIPAWAPRRLSHVWRFAVLQWLQNAINVAKDSVNPILVAAALGAAAAGYVNWAQQTAILGAYFVNAFGRLLFPWFSRLHRDTAALARAASTALTLLSLVTAPVVCAMVFSVGDLVHLVYGARWHPAVPLLIVLAVANIAVPASMVSIAVLNAMGNAQDALWASIGWMAVTWIGVVALLEPFGKMAYGVANILALGVTGWLVARARSYASFDWLAPLSAPWLCAIVSFGVAKVLALAVLPRRTWPEMAAAGLLGSAVFLVMASVGYRRTLIPRLKELRYGRDDHGNRSHEERAAEH